MANIRAFIAVEMPRQIKMELDRLIAGLRPFGPDIRWVRAANLHLTLRFLGDIPESSVGGLANDMTDKLATLRPFAVTLHGLGGFPNLHKPRVIWVGTNQGTDQLVQLATAVEKSCRDCGFGGADKPFSSHLTIGRVKFPKGMEKLVSHIQTLDYHLPEFQVDEAAIFKSDLLPSGPRYSRLEVIRLNKE